VSEERRLGVISGRARLAGVIGWPVGHSLSPRLHGFWLRRYGIDGTYVPLAVRPDDFGAVLAALPKMGFAGANVTVPHKLAALAAAHDVSAEARRIGAVNTLIVREDGHLFGHNTDAFGFIENLRAGLPGFAFGRAPAVVLGAGGAARAVVVALLDAGVLEVRLLNRSAERSAALAASIGGPIRALAWETRAEALTDAGLLVNTTVLGMTGQPPLDLALDRLPARAAVHDIVYAPLETPLLAAAKRRGHPTVDSLGMLLHQGRPGFAAWFGVEPQVDAELRAFMLEGLAKRA